ncbi:MAG: hypothetical protein IPN85_00165 [Flavobacteriales bacterium]|nr:hypothetical protein [Flavobacteriales bacterium]
MNDELRNSNVENTERNENNGKERPKRSFNFYWIYGIIILVILSINLFNYTGGVVPIDPTEYQKMLDAGDVDRIVVVNEQQVRVYIKKDRLSQPPHKDKIKDSFSGPNTVGRTTSSTSAPPTC